MKVSKLFYALTLNLKVYITTTYHLSFCLVIMSDNGEDYGDLQLDRRLSDLNYLEEQDRKAGIIWDEDVEPVAGGRAPEPEVEKLRPPFEIPIFADGNVQGDSYVSNELLLVLTQMFPFCCFEFGDKTPTLDQLFKIVRERCNYEPTGVTRIVNDTRDSMYNHFKKCYKITNERLVYHGTSHANAKSITEKGFRGGVCQRAKYGKGIYTSSDVWEALAYAEPAEGDLTQTVLAVKLLQGPTTIGRQDMADFGTDEHGNEILTATNPEQTIFCAAYGDQLLATYRIILRYLPERKHTPAHHNLVRIYHPTIWNRIKGQTAPAVPPPVFSVPPAAGAGVARPTKHKVTPGTEITGYGGIGKGDKVKLTDMPDHCKELEGQEGIVRLVCTFKRFTRFYVELLHANDAAVHKFNSKKTVQVSSSVTVEKTWLICCIQNLIHIYPPAPVNQTGAGSSSVLGKRPAP